VHFDPAPLAETLAPRLVEELVRGVAALRAEAAAAGCLVEGAERSLRIARCRLAP